MGKIDTKSKFRYEYEHLSNYLTLHFRERRGAALLRFRNRVKITVRKLLRHCGGKTRHVFWKLSFAQESRNCVVVRSRGASLVCRLSVDHRIFTRIDVDESFKGRYTLGDKLQQHVAATYCSDKSLRVYWRIFVKIFVAATEFVPATSRTDSV